MGGNDVAVNRGGKRMEKLEKSLFKIPSFAREVTVMKRVAAFLQLLVLTTLVWGQAVRVPLDGECLLVDPHPRALKVTDDGTIIIADRHHYRFLVFSPEGKFMRAFGEQGEGPGQFKRWFGEYAVGKDGLIYQVDFWGGNRGISVFSPQGGLQRFIRIALEENFGPQRIFLDQQGGIHLALSKDMVRERKGSFQYAGADVVFCALDKNGGIDREYFRAREYFDFSDATGRGWPAIPHRVNLISAWSPEREIIAWQKADENRVTLYSVKEGKTRSVDNGFKLRPLTAAHIRACIEERLQNRKFQTFEPMYRKLARHGATIETHLPVVDRLFFDASGNLYAAAREKESRLWTVQCFNRDFSLGRRLTVQHLPAWIGSKKIYYLVHDEEQDLVFLEIWNADDKRGWERTGPGEAGPLPDC